MNIRNAVILAACLTLAGCASIDPKQLQVAADQAGYGPAPTAGWQDMLKQRIGANLKDPGSAQYQFSEPIHGWVSKAPVSGGGLDASGWLVTVNVNAKNSYGGYAGFESYQFLLRGNTVIRHGRALGGGRVLWLKD